MRSCLNPARGRLFLVPRFPRNYLLFSAARDQTLRNVLNRTRAAENNTLRLWRRSLRLIRLLGHFERNQTNIICKSSSLRELFDLLQQFVEHFGHRKPHTLLDRFNQ